MAKLSGKWTLKAIGNDASWQQRIVISGSNAHDGPHPMVIGTTVPHVEGSAVNIIAQAFSPNVNAWIDSLVQETMNWDNATGLQVTLNVDDNPPHGDLDFNDLVVLCTAENTELASPLSGPRPDLTIPERYYKGRKDNPDQPTTPGRPKPTPKRPVGPRRPL